MSKITTLLVLANERRARFLENTGLGTGLVEIEGLACPPSTDFADRKGRMQMHDSARHGFEPKTLPGDHDRAAFAKELVEVIADYSDERPFDRLIIAAPPKMLGLLRTALPSGLGRRLVYDTPLDLIDERPEGLAPHFAEAVKL